MRIDVTGSEIDDIEPLQTYVTQRLLFVLSRFGGRILRVSVRLMRMQTVSGEPRLGCRLTISLFSGRKILTEVSDTDAYAAIDQAVDRARRRVGLKLVTPHAAVTSGRVGALSVVDDPVPELGDYPRRRRKQEGGAPPVDINRKRGIR